MFVGFCVLGFLTVVLILVFLLYISVDTHSDGCWLPCCVAELSVVQPLLLKHPAGARCLYTLHSQWRSSAGRQPTPWFMSKKPMEVGRYLQRSARALEE